MAARTSSARAARSAAASAAKSSASSARSPGTSTTRPFTTSTPAYRCSSVRTRPNTRLTRRAPSADDANAPWRARSASAAAASAARSPPGALPASGPPASGPEASTSRAAAARRALGASRASRASARARGDDGVSGGCSTATRARVPGSFLEETVSRDSSDAAALEDSVSTVSSVPSANAYAAAMRFAPASAPASATTHVVTGAAKLGSLCAYARTGTSASCLVSELDVCSFMTTYAGSPSSPTSSSAALRLRAAPRSAQPYAPRGSASATASESSPAYTARAAASSSRCARWNAREGTSAPTRRASSSVKCRPFTSAPTPSTPRLRKYARASLSYAAAAEPPSTRSASVSVASKSASDCSSSIFVHPLSSPAFFRRFFSAARNPRLCARANARDASRHAGAPARAGGANGFADGASGRARATSRTNSPAYRPPNRRASAACARASAAAMPRPAGRSGSLSRSSAS